MRAALIALERLFNDNSDIFLHEACIWLGFEHNIMIRALYGYG